MRLVIFMSTTTREELKLIFKEVQWERFHSWNPRTFWLQVSRSLFQNICCSVCVFFLYMLLYQCKHIKQVFSDKWRIINTSRRECCELSHWGNTLVCLLTHISNITWLLDTSIMRSLPYCWDNVNKGKGESEADSESLCSSTGFPCWPARIKPSYFRPPKLPYM